MAGIVTLISCLTDRKYKTLVYARFCFALAWLDNNGLFGRYRLACLSGALHIVLCETEASCDEPIASISYRWGLFEGHTGLPNASTSKSVCSSFLHQQQSPCVLDAHSRPHPHPGRSATQSRAVCTASYRVVSPLHHRVTQNQLCVCLLAHITVRLPSARIKKASRFCPHGVIYAAHSSPQETEDRQFQEP
jgi:hypothetical protein